MSSLSALIAPFFFWSLLWVTGAVVSRAWGLRGALWVASAIPASIVILTAIGFLQAAVDLPFGWPIVVGSAAVVAAVGLLVRVPDRATLWGRPTPAGSGTLALFATSALAGLWVLWAAGGRTLETSSQTWDALFDTNAVRWAYETGSVDPWHLSGFIYPGLSNFYPSTFHAIATLWMNLVGGDAVVAVNVAAALVAGAVWPSVMALAACYLFGNSWRVAVAAVVATAGSMGMPWVPLDWGVLWATATAGAFVPLVAAFFAGSQGWSRTPRPRVGSWVGLAASLLVVFLLHPRVGMIVVTVLAGTWMLVRLAGHVVALRRGERRGLVRGVALTLLPLVVAVPIVLFVGREGTTVVARIWPIDRGPVAEVVGYLLAGPAGTPPQPLMVALVVFGLVAAWRAKTWWLPAMLLVATALDIATATIMGFSPFNGIARFWYNDRHRTVVVPATPVVLLAVVGFETVARSGVWQRLGGWRRPLAWLLPTALCLMGWISGARVVQNSYISAALDPEASLVSPTERDFYRQVADLVQPGEVVLNNAKDGSGLLYAYTGVRTVFALGGNQASTDYGLALREGFTTLPKEQLCPMVANDRVTWVINGGPTFAKGVIERDDAPGMTIPDGFWATTPALVDGRLRLFRITGCDQG